MKLISHSLIHVCVLILTIRFMGLVKRVDYADQPPLPSAPKQVKQESGRVSSASSGCETLLPRETVYALKLPEQPDFLMPYNLAGLINGIDKDADGFFDFRPIWDRLGVTRDNDGAFDGISRAQSGPWTAQVLRANNPNRGSLVILFISTAGGTSRRYVVFRWGSTSWQVTGNIDILDYKYEGSPHQQYHRLVTNSQNTWLALRSLAASGTGWELKSVGSQRG